MREGGYVHSEQANEHGTQHPSAPLWGRVVLLGFGIFTLVTLEQLPIGLLPLMTSDLHATDGAIGLAVTLPGILAAVIALILPGITRGIDRRLILVASLAAVVLSTVGSALAPSTGVLMASRILTGFAIGMYWPVMPQVALAHVPRRHSAAALSIAFAGVGSAVLLGIPLSTWLGTTVGWRESFLLVGGIAAVVGVLQLLVLRPVHSQVAETVRSTLRALSIPTVKYGFLLACTAVTAQFISYSYVTRILEQLGGVRIEHISAFLLAYGVVGLLGNFAGGAALHRSPWGSVCLLVGGMIAALTLMVTIVHDPVTALIATIVWGAFAGMLSVTVQGFVLSGAGKREDAAVAINSSAFNGAIALGALIGGILVDRSGIVVALTASLALLAVSAGILAAFRLRQPTREGAAGAPSPTTAPEGGTA